MDRHFITGKMSVDNFVTQKIKLQILTHWNLFLLATFEEYRKELKIENETNTP